jgi:hypothetical protein
MNLLLSIIASIVITFAPQTTEAPQTSIDSSTSIELGADGCPIEEPCWDYEAENVSDMYEAFGFNTEEEAMDIVSKLPKLSSDRENPMMYEYSGSVVGGTQDDLDPTYFTIESPTHEGVLHIIHVEQAWNA